MRTNGTMDLIVLLILFLLALGAWYTSMLELKRRTGEAVARAQVYATIACFWALLILVWAFWMHR